jgi:hypothetical protein
MASAEKKRVDERAVSRTVEKHTSSKSLKYCSSTEKTVSGETEDDHEVKPSKSLKHTCGGAIGERDTKDLEMVTTSQRRVVERSAHCQVRAGRPMNRAEGHWCAAAAALLFAEAQAWACEERASADDGGYK